MILNKKLSGSVDTNVILKNGMTLIINQAHPIFPNHENKRAWINLSIREAHELKQWLNENLPDLE